MSRDHRRGDEQVAVARGLDPRAAASGTRGRMARTDRYAPASDGAGGARDECEPSAAGTRRRVGVTVVATVRDEGSAIDRLMASLLGGTRLPDAIVIVDGGSRDSTLERLRRYADGPAPLEIVSLPGANIAQGRNAAFARARTEWVAVTDAGVRLHPAWLDRLLEPAETVARAVQPDAIAGFFRADPANTFEEALGAATLPLVGEIDPATFLPSSRSFACTVRAWADVAGYPEWLDYGEDVVFDLRLRLAGARIAWAPTALAYFRPRGTLGAFWRQYYRYARGDGKANLWPNRHAIRYAAYGGAALALVATRREGSAVRLALAAICAAGLAYMRRPARRVLAAKPRPRAAVELALLPILRILGDCAKMVGYPIGLAWRIRHRPPDWRRVSPRPR